MIFIRFTQTKNPFCTRNQIIRIQFLFRLEFDLSFELAVNFQK